MCAAARRGAAAAAADRVQDSRDDERTRSHAAGNAGTTARFRRPAAASVPQHPRTLAAMTGMSAARSVPMAGCRRTAHTARLVGATLVATMRLIARSRDLTQGRPRDQAFGHPCALRAVYGGIAIAHGAQFGKRATPGAPIFIQGHAHSPEPLVDSDGSATFQPAMARSAPPLTLICGPDVLGMMSKSKISVGIHSVAQALGMSTMPLMCPSTGAVPRMA